MKKDILNSRLFLVLSFVILLAVIPFSSKSQTDTISTLSKIEFNQNLIELGNLYCWSDSTFYQGEVQINSIENIEEKFNQLKFPFFQNYSKHTGLYVRFLEDLPIDQKQNLIRYFSFYEKQFEKAFIKESLPVELKYLAPAFSAMNPIAESTDKRAGIWQLSHFQGVLNGIQINGFIDERFDVSLSTDVVAKQIKKNFDQFNSYEKAIAAYLFGNVKMRNVLDLVEENGGEFADYLPKSYIENISLLQAVSIFLNENIFEENIDLLAEKVEPDTAKINRQLHLKQVADVLGISFQQLQYLNPRYKFSIVPENKKLYPIILPEGEWDDFVLWQDSIYNAYDSALFQLVTQKIEYPPSPNRQYAREQIKDLEIEGKTKIKYRLKTGDVLGIIAEDYDVRVADLKYWNNIFNERKIQAGKNLDIFVDDEKVDYYLSLAAVEKKTVASNSIASKTQKTSTVREIEDFTSAKKVEHKVKSGESPYVIAKKYSGVTADQILEWNNIDDARKIQIGQILIVYLKNETR